MDRIKNWFAQKGLGFWFTAATLLLAVLSLISFCVLSSVSEVIDEKPSAVIALIAVAIVLCLAIGYRDFYNIASIVLLTILAAVFFLFVYGRVSYLAYYFSGDIQGTGLSVWCVLTFVFLLLALIGSVLGLCFKHTKIQISNKNQGGLKNNEEV